MNRNIEPFIGCESEYSNASIVLFGAPFDSTTSYRPGTRFAAKAMRAESFGIETYSPYQDSDLSDAAVFDAGDIELGFGDPSPSLDRIEEFAAQVLNDGKLPLMIGGEHLVTLGAVKAAIRRYPNLRILHFDAHADLRDDYLGAKLSHATVMRRVWELVGDNRIFQFGIRSGDKTEFIWAKEHIEMYKFNFDMLPAVIDDLMHKPVYLSIDLDVLDPSEFPGTGTPEAGGVSFRDLLDAILKAQVLNIVACDMCELCPVYDQSGASTAMANKLLRELILSLKHK